MQEHAIPQDITGYRFHIIGNMTIKQFVQMGVGCVVAFIIYSTNLIDVLKWPLIGLSIGTGALVAFVPFEERPFDHWLTTFIKILYKPTKFYWKREARIPDAFSYSPKANLENTEANFDLSPIRRERIREYLRTENKPESFFSQEVIDEQNRIFNIMQSFASTKVETFQKTDSDSKPNLKVQVRGLGKFNESHQFWGGLADEQNTSQTTAQFSEFQVEATNVELKNPLPTAQVAQDIKIPEQNMIKVVPAYDEVGTSAQIAPLQLNPQEQAFVSSPNPEPDTNFASAQETNFNSQLPFPTPPTEPNIVVGMVLTPQHDLVNDAIVEVKDKSGATIRAVKTNALGQFFISTPLPEGDYFVVTEKDDLSFSPIQLQVNNQVVRPIEIRSN
jgi:hypothetical protein